MLNEFTTGIGHPEYESMTVGTSTTGWRSANAADAWVAFARGGDPNHPGLPKWQAVTAKESPVMILDNTCELKKDPDGQARRVILPSPGASEPRP